MVFVQRNNNRQVDSKYDFQRLIWNTRSEQDDESIVLQNSAIGSSKRGGSNSGNNMMALERPNKIVRRAKTVPLVSSSSSSILSTIIEEDKTVNDTIGSPATKKKNCLCRRCVCPTPTNTATTGMETMTITSRDNNQIGVTPFRIFNDNHYDRMMTSTTTSTIMTKVNSSNDNHHLTPIKTKKQMRIPRLSPKVSSNNSKSITIGGGRGNGSLSSLSKIAPNKIQFDHSNMLSSSLTSLSSSMNWDAVTTSTTAGCTSTNVRRHHRKSKSAACISFSFAGKENELQSDENKMMHRSSRHHRKTRSRSSVEWTNIMNDITFAQ